jgi:hypothetical protein
MKVLAKFARVYKKLVRDFWIDSDSAHFISEAQRYWPRNRLPEDSPQILIEQYDDSQYPWLWGHYANHLASTCNAEIRTFYFAKTLLGKIGLGRWRLKEVYRAIGAEPGLSIRPSLLRYYRCRNAARALLAKVKAKEDLLELEYGGYQIGTLVIQSFLRAGHETVHLGHPYLLKCVQEAIAIIEIVESYFKKNKVIAVFLTHTVFTYYGILCRVADRHGVKIFRGGQRYLNDRLQASIINVAGPHFFQENPPPWKYSEIFRSLGLAEREAAVLKGKGLLVSWLGGRTAEIGGRMPGRKTPSWKMEASGQPVFASNDRPNIVIMLNCFFDSPHFYRHSLFVDFFEWLRFTLTTARETDYNWYLKSHPNAMDGNEIAIAKVLKLFPEVGFIDGKKVSNGQLLNEGLNAVFSVHGTALHEFPYLGVPAVSAGDNACANYNFCYQPATLAEYEALVRSAGSLKCPTNLEEMGEFAYMHYQFLVDSENENPFITGLDFRKFVENVCGGNLADSRILRFHFETNGSLEKQSLANYFDKYFKEKLKPKSDLSVR